MASNQVVTRAQFEAFLANPKGEGRSFDILRGVPEAQRQLLFDVGRSVCKIDNPDGVGSGFHLGGGWVMTALHVISNKKTMGAEHVSQSTFHFPTKPAVIKAAPRLCIFPILPPKCIKVKDIALIHVPEVVEGDPTFPGLGHPDQEPPKTEDSVHLVHFGDDDQKFSINGKIILDQKVEQDDGRYTYTYSTFKAYSPSGSSGAPLLIFRENSEKFLVGGVHYEGSKSDKDGDALWFSKKNWLHDTIYVASDLVGGIVRPGMPPTPDGLEAHFIDLYKELQKHLEEHDLRIIVNKSQPDYLTGVFQNISFKSE